MRLTGRTLAITGGSSGIGRAIALAFAREGAFVAVGDVRTEPREGGTPTHQLLGDSGTFVQCDVTDPTDVDRLIDVAVARSGRLDVMIPAAILAGRHSRGLLETTDADWQVIVSVGLTGVFHCCRRAIDQMLDQEPIAEARGRVILISSQHGMVGTPGHIAYCAVKGAIVNMTRQLAVDFGTRGVVVNAIAPGKILTTPLDEPDTEDILAYSRARTPFHRLGQPTDVAGAAVWLASDDCRFVSGVNLPVDGGWMAY